MFFKINETFSHKVIKKETKILLKVKILFAASVYSLAWHNKNPTS